MKRSFGVLILTIGVAGCDATAPVAAPLFSHAECTALDGGDPVCPIVPQIVSISPDTATVTRKVIPVTIHGNRFMATGNVVTVEPQIPGNIQVFVGVPSDGNRIVFNLFGCVPIAVGCSLQGAGFYNVRVSTPAGTSNPAVLTLCAPLIDGGFCTVEQWELEEFV